MELGWNVLYFPKMSVPQNDWFATFVLYFDQCGIIVPYDGFDEEQDEVTKELVNADFVKPVAPMFHYNWGTKCDRDFLNFLLGLRKIPGTDEIHPGKIEYTEFFQGLIDRGLAKKSHNGPYFDVARPHAKFIMTYLALQLGPQPGVSMVPTTESEESLKVITANPSGSSSKIEGVFDVISGAFAVPSSVDLRDVLDFKQKYRSLLREFQNGVEGVAQLHGAAKKEKIKEITSYRDDLVSAMNRKNWQHVDRFDFAVLLSTVAASLVEGSYYSAAAGMMPIAKKIIDEAGERENKRILISQPLAYGALARHRLSR